MKKCAIILISILLALCDKAYGSEYISEVNTGDINKIIDMVVEEKKEIVTEFSIETYEAEKAYVVKPLLNPYIILEYKNNKSLEGIVADYERVIVPCITKQDKKSVLILCKKENTLSYLGQTVAEENNEFNQILDLSKLESRVAEISDSVINKTIYVSDAYNTYIVYIKTDAEDYVIPVMYTPFLDGDIESYKLYKVDDFFQKMDTIFIEELHDNSGGIDDIVFGSPIKYRNEVLNTVSSSTSVTQMTDNSISTVTKSNSIENSNNNSRFYLMGAIMSSIVFTIAVGGLIYRKKTKK